MRAAASVRIPVLYHRTNHAGLFLCHEGGQHSLPKNIAYNINFTVPGLLFLDDQLTEGVPPVCIWDNPTTHIVHACAPAATERRRIIEHYRQCSRLYSSPVQKAKQPQWVAPIPRMTRH